MGRQSAHLFGANRIFRADWHVSADDAFMGGPHNCMTQHRKLKTVPPVLIYCRSCFIFLLVCVFILKVDATYSYFMAVYQHDMGDPWAVWDLSL